MLNPPIGSGRGARQNMSSFRKIIRALPFRAVCVLLAVGVLASGVAAQVTPKGARPPSGDATVRLEAEQQRKEGDFFFADGNVEILYRNYRLRADHVQYNAKTYEAAARGHVQLDVDTQHLAADSGEFNVKTGVGRFEHVRGEVKAEHRSNAYILVSPNPLTFEAQEVRRIDSRTYTIEHAWLTVCEPNKPNWKFFTSHATVHVDRSVAMVNANFRLFRIPLLYAPYATAPAGSKLRQSGFLMPEFSDTSLKGLVLGDAYYWAPKDWTDLTLGAEYLSRRGWQQNGEFRAKPWENVNITAKYFGVIDRGLPDSTGAPVKQGGHSAQLVFDSLLNGGWRGVANLNQLTSLTFQLAFAPTFGEAVNSEVRSTAFLTNNFHGFSANFAAGSYKNFVNAQPEVAVILRNAPEARFSSVDQSPWSRVPVYFGMDAFAGAVHRSDENLVAGNVEPGIETPSAVERSEIAPRIVLPLHWGPWLGVTTSYTVRTTSYGAQEIAGKVVTYSLRRVNQFDHFIRFDEDETLTDTNEFMYSITQRLFHRAGDGQADELVSWRVAQKYFFDPTFNGALVPGTRNVFQALDSITPFAFAEEPRHFSPIDSDLRVTPGGDYDAQIRLEYDTRRQRLTTAGTLLKIRPYQNFNFTVAHFSIDNNNVLQPLANQIRTLIGYGDLNRRGWNASFGMSYDIKQQHLQNQLMQVSYNGSCCGIAIEYRRLALGQVRTENQFRVALIIANIGTFGNLRRQEKLF